MAMAIIQSTGNALLDPLVTLWNGFALALPGIVAALVVLAIGYIVGSAFGYLLHRFLEHARIDQHIRRAGVSHSIGYISIPSLSGGLLKWYIFSLFLVEVAGFARLGVISSLLKDFALWVPNLILGIMILLGGFIITDYLADRMLHAKRSGVRFASTIVRWFLLVFVVLTALDQVGINVSLATNTTLILMGGLALGLGLAVGLGFGFALKDEAKIAIRHLKKGFN